MTKQQLAAIATAFATLLNEKAPTGDFSAIEGAIDVETLGLLKDIEVVRSGDARTLMLEAEFADDEGYKPMVAFMQPVNQWRLIARY